MRVALACIALSCSPSPPPPVHNAVPAVPSDAPEVDRAMLAIESGPLPSVHAPLGEFPLPHGHAIPCRDCHWDPDKSQADFTMTANCNSSSACHGGDHEPTLGPTCTTCHPPGKWEASRFDHDQPFPAGGTSPVSSYPLRGKHAQVPCADCHVQYPHDHFQNYYTGAATTCIGCHRDDDRHRGSRGDDCAHCHNESRWR